MQYMFQDLQKALAIPPVGSNDTTTTQKRGHPARKIQPLSMLAGRRNLKRPPTLRPSPSQTRMQAIARLILKDNCLLWLKAPEFFLRTDESAWHPQSWLADKRSWHASSYNPTDASNTALAEPLYVCQSISSNGQRTSDHPSQHETSQSLGDFSPNDPPVSQKAPLSAGPDGQLEVLVGETQPPVRSLPVSTDSGSCGLDPIRRLSIPNAGPPIPAKGRQSLCRSTPLGVFWQYLTTADESLRGALRLVFSWK